MNSTSPRHSLLLMLCATASLAVVFLLNYNFILSHYFRTGAYIYDSSWLGSLVHEPELLLRNPLIIHEETRPPFFYATHFAAIHVLIGFATHLIATNTIYVAAVYFAVIYTFLSAVFAFLLWKIFDTIPSQWPRWAMALIIATAPLSLFFSGPVLSAVGYPNYEFLIGAFGALLFYHIGQKRYGYAVAVGLLVLLTREDAGLHLVPYFVAWICYLRLIRGWTYGELSPWLVSMIAMLGGSIVVFVVQKTVFPGYNAAQKSYFGVPAYAHVTIPFLQERATKLAANMGPLAACVAGAALASAFAWNIRYILGYIACIPWVVFSFFAVKEAPGTLALYYAYPFALAMMWPLLALLLPEEISGTRTEISKIRSKALGTTKSAAKVVIALVLAGYVTSTYAFSRRHDLLWMLRSMRAVPQELQASALSLQGMILNGLLTRELIGVDDAVASLAPKSVLYEQRVIIDEDPSRFRAVGFNPQYLNANRLIKKLIDHGFQRSYRIGVSSFYVAVNPTVAGDELAQVLRAEAGGGITVFEQSYFFPRLMPGPFAENLGPFLWARKPGLIAYGPYIPLSTGGYRVAYSVSGIDCAAPMGSMLEVAVTKNLQAVVLDRRKFALDALKMEIDCTWTISLEFVVDSEDDGLFEFPIWLIDRTKGIVIRNMTLAKE